MPRRLETTLRRRVGSSSVRDRLTTFSLSRLPALRPEARPLTWSGASTALRRRRRGISAGAFPECSVPFTLAVDWCQFASRILTVLLA